MRILGIDPGYATTGFGILQAERASVQLINYGTITTPTTLSFPERLEMLYDDMAELLDTVRPDAVAAQVKIFLMDSYSFLRKKDRSCDPVFFLDRHNNCQIDG